MATFVKIASQSVQAQQKVHEYTAFLCTIITVFPEYSHALVQPFSIRYAIILMPFGLFNTHTRSVSTLSAEMQPLPILRFADQNEQKASYLCVS